MDHEEEACHLILTENPPGPWVCCCGIRSPREQGLVYFKDVSPKSFTRAVLTVTIFTQLGWAQVLNARREGSLLVGHEGLLMDIECPERSFGCRALIFIHHEQSHYTSTMYSSRHCKFGSIVEIKMLFLRGLDGILVLLAPDLPFPGWPCSPSLFTWSFVFSRSRAGTTLQTGDPKYNLSKQCPSFPDPSALLCSKISSSLRNNKSCRKKYHRIL